MGTNDFKKTESSAQLETAAQNYADPFSDIIHSILNAEDMENNANPVLNTASGAVTEDKTVPVLSDPSMEDLPELDTFGDSGEFRSYDGNRQYRSFDTSLPDASPQEFYHFSEQDRELDDDEKEHPNSVEPAAEDADVEEEDENEDNDRPRHPVLKVIAHMLLVIFTALSIVYLVALYSNHPFIVKTRTTYIQTAMATMNHKWLATAIIPGDIIEDVMRMQYETEETKVGLQSNWGAVEIQELPSFSAETIEHAAEIAPDEEEDITPSAVPSQQEQETTIHESVDTVFESKDEETFFSLFWELDYDSVQAYVQEHPEVLDNGWAGFEVNEAGLTEEGTSIKTIYGDQVLALDASEGVVLIRMYLDTSRGVMAICKDTSRVAHCAAETIGVIGQTSGRICEANNGLLSISGSAFWNDEEGNGNGGIISGLGVCNSLSYGSQLKGYYKRIELREDGKMYIVDSSSNLGPGTRDACEFMPAMLIDGEVVLDVDGWDGIHPRTCLGQTGRLETMMVVMEGRTKAYPGCTVRSIAEKMQQYGCVQALNLDGGTSAIMYYKGEYITVCSNENLPSGRALPTAWVYKYSE